MGTGGGRRRRTWVVAAIVMLAAIGALGDDDDEASTAAAEASDTTTAPPSTDATGRREVVGSITDGDTFRTDSGERIRLIGIDTPEVGQDACFAAEATAALASLVPPGTAVRLVEDVEPHDRYGRTLAYVHRDPDDLFVNRELAAQGYALQLTVPPNVARADELGAAVEEARAAGRGLWTGCTATTAPPATAPPATEPPATAPPATGPLPPQPVVGSCDPSYPGVCIPPAPPDLDCGEVPHRRFQVAGSDPHGFDGDHDGVGCES